MGFVAGTEKNAVGYSQLGLLGMVTLSCCRVLRVSLCVYPGFQSQFKGATSGTLSAREFRENG